MITRAEIQEEVEKQLLKLFPGLDGHLYRNRVPVDFERPAAMTLLQGDTMECRSHDTVARSVTALVTLFCPVDEYHNSDMDALSAMSDAALEHFSALGIEVGDRWLDIGKVSSNVQYDYAEVSIPLSWDDDRAMSKETTALMETLHLDVAAKMNMEE